MFECDKTRVQDKIKTFSTFGATGKGGVTRIALSKPDLEARGEFIRRMKAAGATIETDDLANTYATIPGSEPCLPRIAMGSHCDSVRQGGNYDGILGVIGAMEVVEAIVDQKIPHRHPITAMIWTNEEGALHLPTLMCSGIVNGRFDKATCLASTGVDGSTFGQALEASGYVGPQENRLSTKNYRAHFELHIEQGPILESEDKDIGVVPCVAGMVCYRIKAHGQAGHAGALPMRFRKDALYAAAQAIMHLHQEFDKLDTALVYTTGEIVCTPGHPSIIPEYVGFTLDARHSDSQVMKQVVEVINNIPKEISGCKIECEKLYDRDVIYFDKELVACVQKNVDKLGYSNMPIISGAGHDSQFTSAMMPTTMIFVPSKGGRSHCEEEYTSLEQCCMGINVMLNTVLEVDQS